MTRDVVRKCVCFIGVRVSTIFVDKSIEFRLSGETSCCVNKITSVDKCSQTRLLIFVVLRAVSS